MRKTMTFVIMAIIGSMTLLGCTSAQPGTSTGDASPSAEPLEFGYIMPGGDPWYVYAKDGFLLAAAQNGVEVSVVNSNYDQQTELANVDDLITKGVDGINIFSFNPDGAQLAAQKANEAGIPLTIEMSALADGPGEIVTDVEFDWSGLGVMMADKLAENFPGARVLEITGLIGQGPVDLFLAALQDRMEELGKNELVSIQAADYSREKAMNVMQNMLQSGEEFDVVHVGNEDMAMGVIQVLKDAGKLNNPIKVVSNNGSPEGLEAIKAGDLTFTVSTSPGVEGLVCFEALYRHVMGQTVPKQVMIPMAFIDKSNVDTAVAWEVDEAAYEQVRQMFDDLAD